MFTRLRALLGFALLAGLLAFPAAAWNAHLLSSPVAVSAHHHHDGQVDAADGPDDGHEAGTATAQDDAPGSHRDGDGGHTHLPSVSVSLDAQMPAAFVAPMPSPRMVLFAPRLDVTRRGLPTPPQKRPPRLG